ncbi:VanZ family protein [Streptacidiphilus sp. PB12-B1b]|uniref:VanZ family protein n=1 Tax=Streptacidiphilus sp. PB12-B1b TaxID=2705012 RepID=UPI001CDCBB9C|nr:VanZ family protein [Streptacidiphilus sp. PB12-B1b]
MGTGIGHRSVRPGHVDDHPTGPDRTDTATATAAVPDDPADVNPGSRRLGLLLIAVHLGLVLWLAFRPISAAWMADTNLTPFATVRSELTVGTAHAYLELLRGLLQLAPLGVLLPLAGGRRDAALLPSFLRTVFAGLLVATGVELLQSTLSSHLLDVDDVLLAGIGIGLVHLLVVPAARATLRRRDRLRATPPLRPTFEIAPSPH